MTKSESLYSVRRIEPRDETRWRELWDAYTRFYKREPREDITRHAWTRLMDESSPMYAFVAEDIGQRVVGIANYVIHDSTSQLTPVCYLQDLFVDPGTRGSGVGRLLIDRLIEEMKAHGWSRLYWNTREENHIARALYDKYTPHSGFVKYVIPNPLI